MQREILPFERPFVVAHEWSHLAGFADESEANFVGWLTCLRGSVPIGTAAGCSSTASLRRGGSRRSWSSRGDNSGPAARADLQAIAQRLRQQVSPEVSAVGWRVYHRYLKANRIEAGARSYA